MKKLFAIILIWNCFGMGAGTIETEINNGQCFTRSIIWKTNIGYIVTCALGWRASDE